MQDERPFKFTVFTATFERASTLPRVKASLEAQTYRDFEWLIVDDGSADGTDELVASWQESSTLTIRYVRQAHGGKHVAFNRGVREAQGELFLSLDSDDECVPQALERLLHHWESIPLAVRGGYSAVTARCQYDDGTFLGDPLPWEPYDSDSLTTYLTAVNTADKWGFQRTDVLRRYPFPEPDGASFVPESLVWFAIGRSFRTRYVNEPLLIVHADSDRPRLSHLSPAIARGRRLLHQALITEYMDCWSIAPVVAVKSGINYCRYSFHGGIGPVAQLRSVDPLASKLLVVACMLAGGVTFARDVVRMRRVRS